MDKKMVSEWIAMIRKGPAARDHIFDFWEEQCGNDFGMGEAGLERYKKFLGYVRTATGEKDVRAFQNRFGAMLDQDMMGKQALRAIEEAVHLKAAAVKAAEAPQRPRKYVLTPSPVITAEEPKRRRGLLKRLIDAFLDKS